VSTALSKTLMHAEYRVLPVVHGTGVLQNRSTTVRVNTDKNVGHITVVDYYYHVARSTKDKKTTTGARMRIVQFPTAHCMFRMDITVHSYDLFQCCCRQTCSLE
jgi:hypothetical protein